MAQVRGWVIFFVQETLLAFKTGPLQLCLACFWLSTLCSSLSGFVQLCIVEQPCWVDDDAEIFALSLIQKVFMDSLMVQWSGCAARRRK